MWDFTQDYARRPEWDYGVRRCNQLQTAPQRVVELVMSDGSLMRFEYKHEERPYKTTVQALDIRSSYVQRAAGVWTYEELGKGTLWTQSNSVELKQSAVLRLIAPLIKTMLRYSTHLSMRKAKRMIEK